MEPSAQRSSNAVPLAIIAGFAMIALAIYFTNSRSAAPSPGTETELTATETNVPSGQLPPITESDYILGNPNAEILIVEYADYECAYCKQLHGTLQQIMDEFGVGGRVAWVYRQFPIGQLHPNAPRISEAALCVGDIGGTTAFWNFTNTIYNSRDFNEPTNMTKLTDYAVAAGVSAEQYNSCMASGEQAAAVTKSLEEGFDIGVRGTPYTVIVIGNEQVVLTGSESYEILKGILGNLLDQLDGTFVAPESQP